MTNYHLGVQIKILLILLVFLSSTNDIVAQEYEYKNNSIYASLGTIFFTSQYSISYERTIYQKGMKRIRLKANYGIHSENHADLDGGAKEYKNHKSISGVFLYGVLELNAGIAFIQYTLTPDSESPDPNIDYSEVFKGRKVYFCTGLRHEKNNFVLRAGVSNLELLYVGIGFNF